MQKTICILIAIVSLILYMATTPGYSWMFCAICATLYVFNSVVCVIPEIRKRPINFSLVFSLSLFATSFLFPIFVYPIDPSFSLFSFGYDASVINKCTALATLAHSIYWLGHVNNANKAYNKFIMKNIVIDDKMISVFNKLVIILFIAFLFLGGLQYYTDRYLEGNMSMNISFQYLNVLFQTIAITLACMLYYAEKRSVFFRSCVTLGVICVLILATGSRTLPMYIILVLAYVYQKRYNASLVRMSLIGGGALLLFVIIGQLRNEVISLDQITSYRIQKSELGYFDSFIDFIVCNRNLYDMYSYVDSDGILWGKNFLGSILSIVPFAQGIVSNLLGIPTYQLDSAYFCTYQIFGSQASLGLGTHVVGDVYLASGLIGVICLFYFLGSFVAKLRNGMITNSHLMTLSYLYMLSYSIFICRGSFFGTAKGIIWMLVAIYIVNKFVLKRR